MCNFIGCVSTDKRKQKAAVRKMTGRSREWLPASTTQFGQSFPNFHQKFLLQTPPPVPWELDLQYKKLQGRMRTVRVFLIFFLYSSFLTYTRGNCHLPQHCEIRHVGNEFMKHKFSQSIKKLESNREKRSACWSKASPNTHP